jgi:hypothetical protein
MKTGAKRPPRSARSLLAPGGGNLFTVARSDCGVDIRRTVPEKRSSGMMAATRLRAYPAIHTAPAPRRMEQASIPRPGTTVHHSGLRHSAPYLPITTNRTGPINPASLTGHPDASNGL